MFPTIPQFEYTLTFHSDVCLVIAAYNETFVDGEKKCQDIDSQMASDKLVEFLRKMVGRFFELLRLRVKAETSLEGIAVIVRALDRFYRRLQGETVEGLNKIFHDFPAHTHYFVFLKRCVVYCHKIQPMSLPNRALT